MRSADDFETVQRLVAAGLADREIALHTAVPKSTVSRWRLHPERRRRTVPPPPPFWRPPNDIAYCYLLDLYLGDGHIVARPNRSPALKLSLDQRYPNVIASASRAMSSVAPEATIRYVKRPGCLVVWATDSIWTAAFPQHGAGRKHKRPIRLADWQQRLTTVYPEALLSGLVHSDGCRTVNRFTVRLPVGGDRQYEYARYSFSNLSADIRAIFCEHCELLGVRWSQSNARNISVSDRRSVAILDAFVGPKR